jgi:nucleoside-diphosphate-sugar epimerase
MKVAVTGGSGKLGRATIRSLLHAGHEPISFDLVPPVTSLCPWSVIDFTDYGQVQEALTAVDWRHTGVDAVVHLAAIPGIGLRSNATTYRNNHLATYNVFNAARNVGIKNIAWASSETLFGIPIDDDPSYLPFDEESPIRPTSNYALAKLSDETIAREFCAWDPSLKMVGLRLSNVMELSDYDRFTEFQHDTSLRRWNLWAYIDAEDAGEAFVRSLEWPGQGLEILTIASPDTVMDRPTYELLARHFPSVPLKRAIIGRQALQSSDRAQKVLGWSPTRTWKAL